MTKQIELTQGQVAIVDDEDYESLSQYKWHAYRNGNSYYAARNEGIFPFRRTCRMHSQIMPAPKGMRTDHQDQNGLNNQRSNLRVCTHTQNTQNSGKNSNNTSGFKGVCWDKSARKWQAHIRANRKHFYLGRFDSAEAAARAYDVAAIELHGEFANTNFK